ncbi:MAG: DUF1643 domain-containing protein [Myxococcota bacterium]
MSTKADVIAAREAARHARIDRYISDLHTGKCEGMAQVIAAIAGGCSLDDALQECMRTHPDVVKELERRGWTATAAGIVERKRSTAPVPTLRPVVVVDVPPNGPADVGGHAEHSGPQRAEPKPAKSRIDRAPVVFKGTRARGAILSPCDRYRYACWEIWAKGTLAKGGGLLVVIGHNPSTADHEQGDPTFNRGVRFARRMGYAGVCFVNLVAWRATDPKALRDVGRPFGPANGHVWSAALRWGQTFIAAWGHPQPALRRYVEEFRRMAHRRRVELMCLGTTNGGHPKHLMARGAHRIPDHQIPEAWP